MKTTFKSLSLILAVSFGVTMSSCKKEETPETPAPMIDLHELGENNNHMADLGDELHIDADIVAQGRIAKVVVELHNEDIPTEEVMEEFTDLAGQLNGNFHDHIIVPANFTAGDYHFDMTVVDQEGRSTAIEREVEVN
jgi:hypothetical protein